MHVVLRKPAAFRSLRFAMHQNLFVRRSHSLYDIAITAEQSRQAVPPLASGLRRHVLHQATIAMRN